MENKTIQQITKLETAVFDLAIKLGQKHFAFDSLSEAYAALSLARIKAKVEEDSK
jgi:hypothetical protein